VKDEDIPAAVLEVEREKVTARARAEGKPEALLARIGDGAVEKYMNKTVLLRQPSLRDEAVTVGQMVSQLAGITGENICVRRFVRWELAETQSQPSGG